MCPSFRARVPNGLLNTKYISFHNVLNGISMSIMFPGYNEAQWNVWTSSTEEVPVQSLRSRVNDREVETPSGMRPFVLVEFT